MYEEKSSLRLNIPVSADVNKSNVVQMEGINTKEAFADGLINKHSHKLWHQNKLGVRHQNKLGVRHQNKLGQTPKQTWCQTPKQTWCQTPKQTWCQTPKQTWCQTPKQTWCLTPTQTPHQKKFRDRV
ncbi:MAG: hypothetical protein GT601_11255 [Acidaminobacter sp.]|uniref:hypothetical protein n=1 Tax=Acidaminobacter sp. TaxID=1872102 RepID=UPI00137D2F7B|nr:hypothetical protein [Acidaminobacter sp.]MZQ98241.1 hypothetical protein [Acidaminobacter sp.]